MMMMIGDDDKDSGVTHAKSNQNIENSFPLDPLHFKSCPYIRQVPNRGEGKTPQNIKYMIFTRRETGNKVSYIERSKRFLFANLENREEKENFNI